jgi:ABC-type transport system substrate-binding protein
MAATYTAIRDGVEVPDGSPLTTADVAASWNRIIFPPEEGDQRPLGQLQTARR